MNPSAPNTKGFVALIKQLGSPRLTWARGNKLGNWYARGVRLTVRPLTPELWPALEDLFGKAGACNGCWCMYWRVGPSYFRRPREQNKRDLRARVRAGPPP